MRTYTELITIPSFEDRIRYLQTGGVIGDRTFGGSRVLNQTLYRSPEWKALRRKVILRDNGYDLAHPDYLIGGEIYIHHIEPISEWDLIHRTRKVFDMNNLISASFDTHNMIHWGNETNIKTEYTERKPYDTCPWKGV